MPRRGTVLGLEIAGLLVVAMGTMLAFVVYSPPNYEAEALVDIGVQYTGPGDGSSPTSAIGSGLDMLAIQKDPALARHMQTLLTANAPDAYRVDLVREPHTGVFRVIAHDPDPETAAQVANGAADDLIRAGVEHPFTAKFAIITPVLYAHTVPPPEEQTVPLWLASALSAVAAAAGLLAGILLVRGRREAPPSE